MSLSFCPDYLRWQSPMVTPEHNWRRLAQRTARRIRFGATIQKFIPAALLAGLASLVICFVGRFNNWAGSWTLPAGIFSGSLLLLGVAVLVTVRRGKDTLEIGLARLDLILGLHNALSSAAAGRGKWPSFPVNSDDLLRFHWPRVILPYVCGVFLALAGWLIPVQVEATAGLKTPPPRSHEEIAALIAELHGIDVLKREDLLELERQLAEIRSPSQEDWYSHSSLEAADHLQSTIHEQLSALEKGTNKAASSLAALENADDSLNSDEQQRAVGEFKAALQELKNASPGLNQKLMESLSGIDPGNLKSLASGELNRMIEQLKDAAGACKNGQGKGRGGKNGGNGEVEGELEDLLGADDGSGQAGSPGRGGIQRGPGVAPLPLSRNLSELGSNKPESLQAQDISRARPGDAIGTADTEPKLDKDPVRPQNGGAAAAGQGGEAVTIEALLPAEKAVLKSYFR